MLHHVTEAKCPIVVCIAVSLLSGALSCDTELRRTPGSDAVDSIAFPCTLIVSETNELMFMGGGQYGKFGAGDTLVLAFEAGSLALNDSLVHWPPQMSKDRRPPTSFLRRHYGSIPAVRAYLAVDDSASWIAALEHYAFEKCSHTRSAEARFHTIVRQEGVLNEKAVSSLLDYLCSSALIDTAYAGPPITKPYPHVYARIAWKGALDTMNTEFVFTDAECISLAPKAFEGMHLNEAVAYLKLLQRLEQPGTRVAVIGKYGMSLYETREEYRRSLEHLRWLN